MKRLHIIYSGHVQGVGFRYSAVDVADKHEVVGFVKNLPDRRVEVVAEGEESVLQSFAAELNSTMFTYIREKNECFEPGTGEFSSFRIAY
ncbi:MAG: acylphosphatase [Candidatus Margulisbacteria bacterium]|nr:acylphosphatase [Candidatus Margulisiibacteriota bacterium]